MEHSIKVHYTFTFAPSVVIVAVCCTAIGYLLIKQKKEKE